ncbi:MULTISPECIES: heavy-metal-associated domain-containing protein [Streptomyces]|uniref:Heavy metal transport/detoxification protein n=1 Tax=Streptomyces zinciresistens K42 TaxID=700597 RepID=G2G5U5_9ACTN|nr:MULTISPECIES: cation transporter [Streptomyces]EGX61034.1 heavy metal transport/detoxification protein [Streptomyces zinciresistens K42]MDT9696560.1 cation transporter [Streptomyces sp. P17]
MKLFSRKAETETETGQQMILHIEGMHCTSCGLSIDDELEDVPGVRYASTNFRAGLTTVTLAEGTEVDTSELVAAVRRAGDYTARPAG